PGFARLDAAEQTRLLDLAAERFAAEGMGASYNGIIEASGLSKGSMYHYFEGKADLFATVFERELVGWLDAMPWALDDTSADAWWAAWRAMYGEMLAALSAHPRM